MNIKKYTAALSIAGVAALPTAGFADGSVYASIRVGLERLDTGGTDDISLRNFSSRLGMRGETDLGNGLTGYGRYEFGVNTDDTDGGTALNRRHALVGLKGDYGNVFLGQTYHTFYNMVVAPADVPWQGSGFNMIAYRGRTDNGLSYQGDFGPVSIGATAYFQQPTNEGNTANGGAAGPGNASEDIDELELGASFDIGPVTLGVGMISTNGREAVDDPATTTVDETTLPEADDIYGLSASGSFGGVSLAGNYQTRDGNTASPSSITLNASFADFYGHLEMLDPDVSNAPEPVSLTLGYTHDLGPRTLMWFEYQNIDADTGSSNDDSDYLRATLVYNIL